MGQLAYLRQQVTDTIGNKANAEVHKEGTTRVFVASHERCDNHDRDEHIPTNYLEHKKSNDCWVICWGIWVWRKKVGLGSRHLAVLGPARGGQRRLKGKKRSSDRKKGWEGEM
jgi:hypothetical protein